MTASHTDNEILVPSSDAISRPRVLKRGVRSGANTLLKWMVGWSQPRLFSSADPGPGGKRFPDTGATIPSFDRDQDPGKPVGV